MNYLKKTHNSLSAFIRVFLFTAVFLLCGPLNAGPFVKINTIDTDSSFPNILLKVSVQDKDKNWISGLDETNLTVFEDGYRVNYVQVLNQPKEKEILYLIFSLDTSKSISEKNFVKIKKNAKEIINTSSINEKIGLIRFNDKVVLVSNFTSNRQNLVHSLEAINQHGTKTLLYDALYDSIDLVTRSESTRKAVVLFTDGKDEGSSVTFDDVVSFANRTAVPVFVISLSDTENTKVLKRMAKLTGGQHIIVDNPDQIPATYAKFIRNIKTQYLVKYVSMAKQDGQNHLLEVRLNHNNMLDRDMKKFNIARKFFQITVPSFNQILLVLILIILVICILTLLVILIRRKHTRKPQKEPLISKKNRHNAKTNEPFYYEENRVIDDFDLDSSFEGYSGIEKKEHYSTAKSTNYTEAWLILQHNGQNRKFPLKKREVRIGSDNQCDIVIQHNKISEKHCSIKKVDGNYYLYDLVSEVGTRLNNKKLLRPKQLYDWDEIGLGPLIFIFRGSKIKTS